MATCLEVAKTPYPANFDGRNVTPLAGKSLLPVFKGAKREGHQSLCWSTSGSRAVRVGSLKLVSLPKSPWELYDLTNDRSELANRASERPADVERLAAIFKQWQGDINQVAPKPAIKKK